jgi:peptide/nickel transport system ATP-binding protein
MKVPPILSVDSLNIAAPLADGPAPLVIDGVTLALAPGESIGIAGESGSGKSTLLLSMMGVVRPGLRHQGGTVTFEGQQIMGRADADLLAIRGGRLALIPQNAAMSLTPTLRIGAQIDEALRLHTSLSGAARAKTVLGLLDRVHLPDTANMARRYPHELSGGQVQRAAVAMALAGDPAVLLMDEPTTGLDVTTQLALLDLMVELQREARMAIVCVSHDLGVLAKLCQTVAVMYAGSLVEQGPTDRLLTSPTHPYTRALLRSLPSLAHPGLPSAIEGAPPTLNARPPGCSFAPRCSFVQPECSARRPAIQASATGLQVACLHPQTQPLIRDAADVQGAAPLAAPPVLQISGLSIDYGQSRGLNRILQRSRAVRVVDDVSFTLNRGEVLGLVGESGSGKSTILRAIAGIHPASVGQIALLGRDAAAMALAPQMAARPLAHLQTIQMIFQNPESSLNPRHKVFDLLAQPLGLYPIALDGDMRHHAARLLEEVRLGPGYLDRYPSQLSGGERQRVAIARAFAARPDILLCDEITTALDVSVQAAVLRLVRDMAASRDVATIFVSHDLAVVRAISDRIAVLSKGRIVEIAEADDLCRTPRHDYTRALLRAVLEPDANLQGDRVGQTPLAPVQGG